MFTLANQYTFAADPKICWLSAFVDSNAKNRCSASWALKAHSRSALIQSCQRQGKKDAGLKSVAFGIDCNGLSFDVLDWKELEGRSFEIDPSSIEGGFMIFEWEHISALHLTFGHTRGKAVELQAKGRGCVESAPEYFGTDEIEFGIHTWLEFTGVHTEVPINATAPIAFAEAQIKHLFPKYDYANPELIETIDGNYLVGVGVHFPPRETRPT